MDSKESKMILQKLLNSFDVAKDRPNQKYLESQLTLLNSMVLRYKSQSTNPKLSARNRAKARDLEQNCLGLINGIMFALSFLEREHIDLMKSED